MFSNIIHSILNSYISIGKQLEITLWHSLQDSSFSPLKKMQKNFSFKCLHKHITLDPEHKETNEPFFPKLIPHSQMIKSKACFIHQQTFPFHSLSTQHPTKMLLSQWIIMYLITNAEAQLRIQHPFNLEMRYYNDWIEAHYEDSGVSRKSPLSRKTENNCKLSPIFTN